MDTFEYYLDILLEMEAGRECGRMNRGGVLIMGVNALLLFHVFM